MKKENFTLLELVLVLAVMGILISILLPSLSKARYKAKLTLCKSNLAQICRINMAYSTNNDQNHTFNATKSITRVVAVILLIHPAETVLGTCF